MFVTAQSFCLMFGGFRTKIALIRTFQPFFKEEWLKPNRLKCQNKMISEQYYFEIKQNYHNYLMISVLEGMVVISLASGPIATE